MNITTLGYKIDDCATYEELIKVLDEITECYRSICERGHKINKKKTEYQRDKYGIKKNGMVR